MSMGSTLTLSSPDHFFKQQCECYFKHVVSTYCTDTVVVKAQYRGVYYILYSAISVWGLMILWIMLFSCVMQDQERHSLNHSHISVI